MGLIIGSLNLLRNAKNEEQKRLFYDFIYRLIAEERLDIITFQEVYKKEIIDDIIRNISGLSSWKGAHSFGSEFAFIWNSDKVEECSKRKEPQIFSNYKAENRLVRDPMYGRFSPRHLGSSNEIRLLDIHLIHGGTKAGATERRKMECSVCKNEIHRVIDTHRYGNFKRAITVILGDYNLTCPQCNEIMNSHIVQTVQECETTLKKDSGYSNSFDHFSFDIVKNSTVPCEVSRIDAVNKYFGGDFESYRKNVSDHVPIKLEIL